MDRGGMVVSNEDYSGIFMRVEKGTSPENDEEQEVKNLRRRLQVLQKKRRLLQHSTTTICGSHQELLLARLNSRQKERNQLVDEYVSAWKGRDATNLFLNCAKRWNVVNDCFSIWIDGTDAAFPTINGCRLGAEASSLPTQLLCIGHCQNVDSYQTDPQNKSKWVMSGRQGTPNSNREAPNSPPRRRILGFFGGNNDNTQGASSTSLQRKVSPLPTVVEPARVPWLEVNAALGHACLLLRILQESSSKKGGTGMKFTHELHPMGSTSKIGIRFGTPESSSGVLAAATGLGGMLSSHTTSGTMSTPPVIYNLFFEESSGFSFFKNNARNFNWALQAFLQCIAEAAEQQTDKTIAIPHAIRHQKATADSTQQRNGGVDNSASHLNGGEWTIGGLSICFPTHQMAAMGNATSSQVGGNVTTANRISEKHSCAMEWTRACRYLLTDLKWLIAYSTKHVDR